MSLSSTIDIIENYQPKKFFGKFGFSKGVKLCIIIFTDPFCFKNIFKKKRRKNRSVVQSEF